MYEEMNAAQLLAVEPVTDLEKALHQALLLTVPKPKFSAASMLLPVGIDQASWVEWCKYRSEKRKAITKQAADKQIQLLSKYPPMVQKHIIDTSIQNDYQGLFPPKGLMNEYQQGLGVSGGGGPSRARSAAERVRENNAREREAEAAAAPGTGQNPVGGNDQHVWTQMDKPVRGSDRPREYMGGIIEGSYERSD